MKARRTPTIVSWLNNELKLPAGFSSQPTELTRDTYRGERE